MKLKKLLRKSIVTYLGLFLTILNPVMVQAESDTNNQQDIIESSSVNISHTTDMSYDGLIRYIEYLSELESPTKEDELMLELSIQSLSEEIEEAEIYLDEASTFKEFKEDKKSIFDTLEQSNFDKDLQGQMMNKVDDSYDERREMFIDELNKLKRHTWVLILLVSLIAIVSFYASAPLSVIPLLFIVLFLVPMLIKLYGITI